jgi:prepilin-type N-terminal cleavage/methylation domain-containing protein
MLMNSPNRRAARSGTLGFTLIELMVTVLILVTLTVIVTPSIVSAVDAQRVLSSARTLDSFVLAINNPDTAAASFVAEVKTYPGRLSHLTRQIETTDRNGCGIGYSSGEVIPEKWRGPYINRVVRDTGIPIGIGTVADSMTRDDPKNVRSSRQRMRVLGVITEDATALDSIVDVGDGSAGGTVRWGAADADGFVMVEYLFNVQGC